MKSTRDRSAGPAKAPSAPAAGSPRRPYAGVGPRAVASFVPGITRKAFEKHGFAAASLITDWPEIVGKDLARLTRPEKLKWPRGVEKFVETGDDERGRPGATLTLRVDPAAALDVQYRTSQIIERINGYFGYRAVSDMRIVQAGSDEDFAPPTQPASPAPVHSAGRAAPLPAATEIGNVTDEGLRAALERLAASIGQRRGGKP